MKEKKTYLLVALNVRQFDDSDVITASTTGTTSFWVSMNDDDTQDDIFSIGG